MARSEGYASVSEQASGDALDHLLNIQRRIFHLIFAEEKLFSARGPQAESNRRP
jgi:hypothetical protein